MCWLFLVWRVMMNARELDTIYAEVVKPLPLIDRLRLASLILNDVPPQAVVDYNEAWAEGDYDDFSRASWAHSAERLDEEAIDAESG